MLDWLHRFGLNRKPLPGLREDSERHGAVWWLVRLGLLAGLVAVTVLAFPRSRTLDQTYDVNDEWRGEPVVAPYTFAVFKDPAQLASEYAAVRAEVEPYFLPVDSLDARIRARTDSLAAQIDAVAALVRSARTSSGGRALQDSIRAAELRASSILEASPEEWAALDRLWNGPDSLAAPVRIGGWLDAAEAVALSVASRGVMDLVRDSLRSNVLIVRNPRDRTDRLLGAQQVYGRREAQQAAERLVRQQMGSGSDASNVVAAMARSLLRPSLVYLARETNDEVQRRLRSIPTTLGEVRSGEIVVERGQRLTPQLLRTLESLELVRKDTPAKDERRRTLAGQALLAGTTFLLFFLYLYLLRRHIFDSARHLVIITGVMAGVILLFGLAVRFAFLEMLAVPVALATVLFTVVYDSRVGIFATVTLALVGGHLLRYDLGYTFPTLFACTLVAFSVRDLRSWGQFFFSAALLFLAYATVLGAGYLVGHQSAERFTGDLVQVVLHSAFVLVAYPLLGLFERFFGVTTDLTLLNLSHPSQKLLTQLQEAAPGTYSHSLQVASLADACASAVGADPLLTRVGALYHDIGKMRQPEFFIENQRRGENPHDALAPHLSALVIAGHVPEGIAIARQHRLPDTVVRFISQHHGTTRIEYFYRRARAAAEAAAETPSGAKAPEVDEQDYRYPGPRPDCKETAILMLCDGCEAASRSLDDPTPHKLTALVDGILEARRADGQLDRSDLTFDDLRRIRNTIIRLLVGHYHGRVKYPEETHVAPDAADAAHDAPASATVPAPPAPSAPATPAPVPAAPDAPMDATALPSAAD